MFLKSCPSTLAVLGDYNPGHTSEKQSFSGNCEYLTDDDFIAALLLVETTAII